MAFSLESLSVGSPCAFQRSSSPSVERKVCIEKPPISPTRGPLVESSPPCWKAACHSASIAARTCSVSSAR